MVKFNEVTDLELKNEDSFVFVVDGWHTVENRRLTGDEMDYLQDNYQAELHGLACDVLR